MQVFDIYTAPAIETTKRSLVLAGGGIRMSYQAGVLQALLEHGLKFNHVDGTSGGIFNTAMLASGQSPSEMAEHWRKLKVKDFVSTTPFSNYLKLNKMIAWGDADGIRDKVFPALGIDIDKIKSNNKIVSTFNVCNFSRKVVEAIPNDKVAVEHLLAGVSLPIFMPSLLIDDQWYTDAVWIKDANLMEAVRRGAEEIWLVWAIGNTKEYLPGSFNQYVHMIEMSANGALLEEYEQIKLINCNILAGNGAYGQTQPVKLHVIKPEFPLPLDPELFLGKTDADTLINMGYADAKKYLQDASAKGLMMDFTASQMKEPGISFSFRHRFKGILKWANKSTCAFFNPSFILRKTGDEWRLDFYASIFIESFGKEFSTYNNKAVIKKHSDQSVLHLSCRFLYRDKIHDIKAQVNLHSPIDWMLGLEFKNISIQITQEDEQEEMLVTYKGRFTQTIQSRLRSLFQSKTDYYSNKRNGIKGKLTMIKKLYAYEV